MNKTLFGSNKQVKETFINEKIFIMWLECSFISPVLKLLHHPKWFQIEKVVKVGGFVYFINQENSLSSTCHYGMISDI